MELAKMYKEIVVVLFSFSSVMGGLLNEPKVVENFQKEKYLGRWYQTHASPMVYLTFERNAPNCVTADYRVYDEMTISVTNSGRTQPRNGTLDVERGFATVSDNHPAKYTVSFPSSGFTLSGTGPNYWILALGPANYGDSGLYRWAIVSDRTRLFNFVLVRDVKDFKKNYEREIFNTLQKKGMSWFWNLLWPTENPDDCEFAPEPFP